MSWTIYGILILFGMFILLMIFNPRLSCFGKRIASPLYPLLRKKRAAKVETKDYGFQLSEGNRTDTPGTSAHRDRGSKPGEPGTKGRKKHVKIYDYGFRLGDPDQKDKKEPSTRRIDEGGG